MRKLKVFSVLLSSPKVLEDELEDIQNQIKEKILLLDTERMANLSKLSMQLSQIHKSRTVLLHQCSKSSLLCLFLASQIMELHKKIKPLEEEIAALKEQNRESLEGRAQRQQLHCAVMPHMHCFSLYTHLFIFTLLPGLQKKLELSKRQLQDSEQLLKETGEKNFDLSRTLSRQ